MSGRWHVYRRRGCEGWVVVQRGEGASLRFLPSHAAAMTYIDQASRTADLDGEWAEYCAAVDKAVSDGLRMAATFGFRSGNPVDAWEQASQAQREQWRSAVVARQSGAGRRPEVDL